MARTTRTYEPNRDLIDHVENRWIGSGSEPGTLVSKYDYANDDLGRRINVVNTGTAFESGGRNTIFEYDDRSQLTASQRRAGTTPGSGAEVDYQQYSFEYDSIGNRLSYGGEHPEYVKAYYTNELNQYTHTATPEEEFDYDFDGNLIADVDYLYEWDSENRLIGVTPAEPSARGGRNRRLAFEYDYMSRRTRKVTWAWDDVAEEWETTPDSDTRFVYDGWNVVQEIDGLVASGTGVTNVAREYTWGLDLSGKNGNPSTSGIHGAGGIGGLLATRWTNATTSTSDDQAFIYFYDANGNVGQMMDVVAASSGYGTIAAKYEYYPFGGLLLADGPVAEVNPFRFSTKYRDNETGCYYYGYRYLRTKHGRWLSRDPIGEVGGNNLLCALLNDAVNSYDPFGQQTPKPAPTSAPAEPDITTRVETKLELKKCGGINWLTSFHLSKGSKADKPGWVIQRITQKTNVKTCCDHKSVTDEPTKCYYEVFRMDSNGEPVKGTYKYKEHDLNNGPVGFDRWNMIDWGENYYGEQSMTGEIWYLSDAEFDKLFGNWFFEKKGSDSNSGPLPSKRCDIFHAKLGKHALDTVKFTGSSRTARNPFNCCPPTTKKSKDD